ncbi:hypothetical protein BDZ89DRAFT_1144218 [Hymenopellis radicata]|nr:hypothetical protein BDZ89DRAFT_1144218 [Hymenopellis radicata]
MSSSDTPPVVGAAFDGNSSSGWEDIRRYQREAEEILNTPGGLERYIAAYDRYSHSGPLPKSPDYQTLPGTTQWRNHPLPRVRALSLESENTELKAQITGRRPAYLNHTVS